jgi:hypothetical protein
LSGRRAFWPITRRDGERADCLLAGLRGAVPAVLVQDGPQVLGDVARGALVSVEFPLGAGGGELLASLVAGVGVEIKQARLCVPKTPSEACGASDRCRRP